MNILFSTTRQWNPGDEFILHGIRRLLSKLNLKYNPVIYNRHPSITPRRTTLKHRWSKPHVIPHYDNSFILDQDDLIDYVIFAGTPEWYGGKRMDDLHNYIVKNNIRCAFIGVGIPKKPFISEQLLFILNNLTDLFIARDPNCYDEIRKLRETVYLPCPALFSASENKQRNSLNKIGIVIQDTDTMNHNIPDSMAEKLMKEFEILEKNYHVQYIAHYIDDLKYASRKNKEVLYSAYSEDFSDIFNEFDMVISTRVHGSGIASSLGIPNMLIPHDGRFSTAIKFMSVIYDDKLPLHDQIKKINIPETSSALLKHKEDSEKEYLQLFKNLSIFKS